MLWYIYVVLLPFVMLMIWGLIVGRQSGAKAGLGITFFGNFVLLIFLGFCNWKGHNWHFTTFTKYSILGGILSAFIYSLTVTLLPSSFTYSGTSAIFMSINYIFAIALMYIKSTRTLDGKKEKYFKLDILLRNMVLNKLFVKQEEIQEGQEIPESFDKAMEDATLENE
jgi:hypothetical protein